MTTTKAPRNWFHTVSAFIGKIFHVIKLLIHTVWEIISHVLSTIVFFFSLLIKVVADPSTPCVVAITMFMIVCIIAGFQWWQIGVWLGGLMGFDASVLGIASGFVGVMLGLGLNVYQLSPQLWKIRRDVAAWYAKNNVKLNHKSSGEATVKERQENWHSYDHRTLKSARYLTYGIETGLVLVYCALVQNFAFWAIVQAAVSLLLPEKSIEAVSSTISLLGEVSNDVNRPEQKEQSGKNQNQQQQTQQQKSQQNQQPKDGKF